MAASHYKDVAFDRDLYDSQRSSQSGESARKGGDCGKSGQGSSPAIGQYRFEGLRNPEKDQRQVPSRSGTTRFEDQEIVQDKLVSAVGDGGVAFQQVRGGSWERDGSGRERHEGDLSAYEDQPALEAQKMKLELMLARAHGEEGQMHPEEANQHLISRTQASTASARFSIAQPYGVDRLSTGRAATIHQPSAVQSLRESGQPSIIETPENELERQLSRDESRKTRQQNVATSGLQSLVAKQNHALEGRNSIPMGTDLDLDMDIDDRLPRGRGSARPAASASSFERRPPEHKTDVIELILTSPIEKDEAPALQGSPRSRASRSSGGTAFLGQRTQPMSLAGSNLNNQDKHLANKTADWLPAGLKSQDDPVGTLPIRPAQLPGGPFRSVCDDEPSPHAGGGHPGKAHRQPVPSLGARGSPTKGGAHHSPMLKSPKNNRNSFTKAALLARADNRDHQQSTPLKSHELGPKQRAPTLSSGALEVSPVSGNLQPCWSRQLANTQVHSDQRKNYGASTNSEVAIGWRDPKAEGKLAQGTLESQQSCEAGHRTRIGQPTFKQLEELKEAPTMARSGSCFHLHFADRDKRDFHREHAGSRRPETQMLHHDRHQQNQEHSWRLDSVTDPGRREEAFELYDNKVENQPALEQRMSRRKPRIKGQGIDVQEDREHFDREQLVDCYRGWAGEEPGGQCIPPIKNQNHAQGQSKAKNAFVDPRSNSSSRIKSTSQLQRGNNMSPDGPGEKGLQQLQKARGSPRQKQPAQGSPSPQLLSHKRDHSPDTGNKIGEIPSKSGTQSKQRPRGDPGTEYWQTQEDKKLEVVRQLIKSRESHLKDVPELQDSDIEETQMAEVFLNNQTGSKIHHKELHQYLVRKINGFGGIRRLHKVFKDERRALLDVQNPDARMSDGYFKICARYVPLLEAVRKANLAHLYQLARRSREELRGIACTPIEEIAAKIDYEKMCNLGLYNKDREYSEGLLGLTYEDLAEIQEHCNDQVMKQYKINKGRSWVQQVSGDQLYQVFQCFSEDQIFFYEEFEFAILERRMTELAPKEREGSANPLEDALESCYSKNSDSHVSVQDQDLAISEKKQTIDSVKVLDASRTSRQSKHPELSAPMSEHLAQEGEHEEERWGKEQRSREIEEMNKKIAKKFEQEILGQGAGPFGQRQPFQKAPNFTKRSFAYAERGPRASETIGWSAPASRPILGNPKRSNELPQHPNLIQSEEKQIKILGNDLMALDDHEMKTNVKQLEEPPGRRIRPESRNDTAPGRPKLVLSLPEDPAAEVAPEVVAAGVAVGSDPRHHPQRQNMLPQSSQYEALRDSDEDLFAFDESEDCGDESERHSRRSFAAETADGGQVSQAWQADASVVSQSGFSQARMYREPGEGTSESRSQLRLDQTGAFDQEEPRKLDAPDSALAGLQETSRSESTTQRRRGDGKDGVKPSESNRNGQKAGRAQPPEEEEKFLEEVDNMPVESKSSVHSHQDQPSDAALHESEGAIDDEDHLHFGGGPGGNEQMGYCEAQIAVRKKALTRSMFTIDEETWDDGTVQSSAVGGFGTSELADGQGIRGHAAEDPARSLQLRNMDGVESSVGQSQGVENSLLELERAWR